LEEKFCVIFALDEIIPVRIIIKQAVPTAFMTIIYALMNRKVNAREAYAASFLLFCLFLMLSLAISNCEAFRLLVHDLANLSFYCFKNLSVSRRHGFARCWAPAATSQTFQLFPELARHYFHVARMGRRGTLIDYRWESQRERDH
jgi:hypothetical protein